MSDRLVTQSIERLRPYAPGKPIAELERELGVVGACKLAANENPLGPSPKALSAAAEALSSIHRYPDSGCFDLRSALAERLQVTPEELVFGNGSNELLELLVRTFCTPAHHIVMSEHSFVVYPMSALACGVPYTEAASTDFSHDLTAIASAVRPETRLVFIANPNNPTGTYVSGTELRSFLQLVPRDVIVAVDEAYFEYADAEDYPDSLKLRDLHPRLVTLRTFSKAYGLAGLRAGYLVAPAELTQYINRVRAPFNLNHVAQAAAVQALADDAHLREVVHLNRQERKRVFDALVSSGLDIDVAPSQANFLFLNVKRVLDQNRQGPKTAGAFVHALQLRGVITRLVPALAGAFRVSIGLPQENDRFLTQFGALMSQQPLIAKGARQ